jgi:8-oxo-dGTP pyrophosphatase MutT (NUDIX family)/SAM-dependent methyltransferase
MMQDGQVTAKHATASTFVFCQLGSEWRLGLITHPRFRKLMLPGGHVEPDESPSEAALREIAEETGLAARFVPAPAAPAPAGLDRVRVEQPWWIVEQPVPADNHLAAEHVHVDHLYVAVPPSPEPASAPAHPFAWHGAAELAALDMFNDTRLLAVQLFPQISALAATARPAPPGSGPGVITPDGCAVELYALLPPGDDPDIIHRAIPPAATILELGCGTGRVTGPLTRMGHPVVAVDESPEMLARVRGTETVCAKIEDLALGRRFDAVLLASHLINYPDDAVRRALLTACSRHLNSSGRVIIQQHPAEWFADAAPSERVSAEGISFRMRDVSRPGPGLVSATMVYEAAGQVWTQSFTAGRLTEEKLLSCLAEAGLALDRYLTDDRSWLTAVWR